MAKLKRYDLYEGDDDIISNPLPGKQPLGRDAGLKARDEYDRRVEEEARKRRYFASNEQDDGLGAPSTLFDDFDRFESPAPARSARPKYKRKEKHRGAWAAVIVFCLFLLAGMAVAVVPQLTGIRYKFLPNLAFVNGNLIIQDGGREDFFDECRKEVYTGKIYPGVYIDDEHVGGLTKEEAIRKISSLHNDAAGAFDRALRAAFAARPPVADGEGGHCGAELALYVQRHRAYAAVHFDDNPCARPAVYHHDCGRVHGGTSVRAAVGGYCHLRVFVHRAQHGGPQGDGALFQQRLGGVDAYRDDPREL